MSAQKALQGSETETRELLGRTEENSVSSMSFPKKETEKIEFVARPGGGLSRRLGYLQLAGQFPLDGPGGSRVLPYLVK